MINATSASYSYPISIRVFSFSSSCDWIFACNALLGLLSDGAQLGVQL